LLDELFAIGELPTPHRSNAAMGALINFKLILILYLGRNPHTLDSLLPSLLSNSRRPS
jgi:hypothetical protein